MRGMLLGPVWARDTDGHSWDNWPRRAVDCSGYDNSMTTVTEMAQLLEHKDEKITLLHNGVTSDISHDFRQVV